MEEAMTGVWRDPLVLFGLGVIAGGLLLTFTHHGGGGSAFAGIGIGLTTGRLTTLLT